MKKPNILINGRIVVILEGLGMSQRSVEMMKSGRDTSEVCQSDNAFDLTASVEKR